MSCNCCNGSQMWQTAEAHRSIPCLDARNTTGLAVAIVIDDATVLRPAETSIYRRQA